MSNVFDQVKVEPVPPGHHARLGGHHWLMHVDFDGRDHEMVVLQWNPGAKRWSNSGEVGSGYYVDTKGWRYIQPCIMPGESVPTRQMEIREFHILSDASAGFIPVDAVAQFRYNGYLISMSTAGLSKGACQNHVAVFFGNDTEKAAKEDFHTVQEALDWINKNPVT